MMIVGCSFDPAVIGDGHCFTVKNPRQWSLMRVLGLALSNLESVERMVLPRPVVTVLPLVRVLFPGLGMTVLTILSLRSDGVAIPSVSVVLGVPPLLP